METDEAFTFKCGPKFAETAKIIKYSEYSSMAQNKNSAAAASYSVSISSINLCVNVNVFRNLGEFDQQFNGNQAILAKALQVLTFPLEDI